MIFKEQRINGLYLIEPEPYKDKRGMLRRNFCKKELKKYNLMNDIKQINISENNLKHTLRGFHYQSYPYGENKIISCIKGEIYNIVVDMRKSSNTYLKWESFIISDQNRFSLYVPKGCANAYLTMKDSTWVLYYHSQFYKSGHEKGIRYDDEKFNFKWPAKPKIISKKDISIKKYI